MINPRNNHVSRIQLGALTCATLGIVGCIAGAFINSRQFFISYLFGYLFWLGLALGCLGVAMVHHLTGGRWGFVIRRFLESGFRTLPLMMLLFVPLVFGMRVLYPWTTNPPAGQKAHYLNIPGFIARTLVFFVVWLVLAGLLRKWSLRQDSTPDPEPTRRMRTISGPGIVIYPLTATFAYIDWVMSLEPDWYSTIFLVIIIIGQILSAFAFAIVVLASFRAHTPFANVLQPFHFHHLGNLLLTFVMFWTYIAFSQLLIIWSGNLPHEISWYLHRSTGSWIWIVAALALFHFFLPFFLLLFRTVKRNADLLAWIAGAVLVMHLINVFWLIVPSFYPRGIHISWLDFAAPLGIGGLWVALFLFRLKQSPLLPQNDPRFTYLHIDE